MYTTKNYMMQFVTSDLEEMSPEEICILYQNTNDDRCIAAMFCKMCDMFILLKQKYPYLDNEIAVSGALETMTQMMLEFKYNEKKSNKFTTLMYAAYSRRLYGEMKKFQKKKRDYRITNTTLSFDATVTEDSPINNYNNKPDYVASSKEIDLITRMSIDTLDLSEDERDIVSYICRGYNKSDILDATGMSNKDYNTSVKSLRVKLPMIGIVPTHSRLERKHAV